MQTLREVGEFVGITRGALDASRLGGSGRPIGLRLIEALVTDTKSQISLREIIHVLQNLTPITLDVQIAGESQGKDPFDLALRFSASGGIIWFTTIQQTLIGGNTYSKDISGVAGDHFITLSSGNWEINVKRSGISDIGFVTLGKVFNNIIVSAPPRPVTPPSEPPKPVTPPSSPQRPAAPVLSVSTAGSKNAVVFTVTGNSFLANQPPNLQGITVKFGDGVNIQDWQMLHTGSDASGSIRLVTQPLNTTALPRNALGQALVNVMATDSRRDPTSIPKNEPLWSNTVRFTF